MPAFLELVNYVIRAGPLAREYGDPYLFACSVKRLGPAICELTGFAPGEIKDKRAFFQAHRDVLSCLARNGFKTCIERRVRNGKTIVHSFDLTRGGRQ